MQISRKTLKIIIGVLITLVAFLCITIFFLTILLVTENQTSLTDNSVEQKISTSENEFEERKILVFFEVGVSREYVDGLENDILEKQGVNSIEFTSEAEAKSEYYDRLIENENNTTDIEDIDLPSSLEITTTDDEYFEILGFLKCKSDQDEEIYEIKSPRDQ